MKIETNVDYVIIDGERYEKVKTPEPEPETNKIDWSKMPVDTLVAINGTDDDIRYFSHMSSDDGCYFCFSSRSSSLSSNATGYVLKWDEIKLVDNPWRPWFGVEMPCCGNVRVEVVFRDGTKEITFADKLSWDHYNANLDIIAYRMLGEEND